MEETFLDDNNTQLYKQRRRRRQREREKKAIVLGWQNNNLARALHLIICTFLSCRCTLYGVGGHNTQISFCLSDYLIRYVPSNSTRDIKFCQNKFERV